MKAKNIINRESFIKYINIVDKNNLKKYLNLIDFYENTSIHNLYFLSSYIFQRIENRLDSINNLFNYFTNSLRMNIKKLDSYNLSLSHESVPKYLFENHSIVKASEEEIKEISDILNSFK